MWYEILPSAAVVFVAMAAPHGIAYVAHRLVFDNPFRRSLMTRDLRMQYFRDTRLSGDPYKVQGLEAIPDA